MVNHGKNILRIVIFSAVLTIAATSDAQTDRTYLSTPDSTEEVLGTFPKRTGWANDFEKILTANEVAELNAIIRAHQQRSGEEIAVVTLKSYAPYHDIGSYAKDLATVWGVGKSKQDKGLMIMLSKSQGQIQFVPGDGLKTKLTDTILNQVIDKQMISLLQKERFGDALLAGTREVIRRLEQ
jgi:uncharacterized protein